MAADIFKSNSFDAIFNPIGRKVTTLWLLVLASASYCNGQDHKVQKLLNVLTPSSIANARPAQRLDSGFVLVRLRDDLRTADLPVVKRVDNNLVVVRATDALKLHSAQAIHPVNYLWKVSENVLRSDQIKCRLTIDCENPERLTELCSRYRSKIVERHGHHFIVSGNVQTMVDEFAAEPSITYIGMESLAAKEESTVLDLNLSPNKLSLIRHELPDIAGEGITVSVKERQFNAEDIDIKGRIIPSQVGSPDTSAHATDMATIVAGAGNSFITGLGVAPKASLTTAGFENLFPESDSYFQDLHVTVQNHSYGTVIENQYGALAAAYDENANRNRQLLHVFSSGNVGDQAAPSGTYSGIPGFANLTGNEKMSKNSLVVGSVDTTGRALALSSSGPTFDGRLKPELVAYSMVGTSNSAALVSGAAVLLQDQFKKQYGTSAESALIKAMLITAASDVATPGPDYKTGFGNLDGYRAILNLKANNFFEGQVSPGGNVTVPIAVPAGAKNLKISLVWNDPAAPSGSSRALINDLDLTVVSNAVNFLPWTVSTTPNTTSLAAPAIRGADHVNNVEQVTIEEPESSIIIEVRAFDSGSNQKFALAWQWDTPNEFEWHYPTASDNFPYNGETTTYFYWRSTLPQSTGTLELSLDEGGTWQTIKNNIDLRLGYFRWTDLPEINAIAIARMRVGVDEFQTEPFVISRPVLPRIGFNCGDSVLLQWPQVSEATGYRVYGLKSNYSEPVLTTSDTSWIFEKEGAPEYFAIEPILTTDHSVLRSPAISYNVFGVGCFLISFVDEVRPEEGIVLILQLSTTYGIEEVVIEREDGGTFKPVHSMVSLSSTITFLDDHPQQGLNRYRAVLKMKNGTTILSDAIEDYYLTTVAFIVFPNPVRSGSDLKIFSKRLAEQQIEFTLYRADGVKAGSQQLSFDREYITLENIRPGIYVYSIEFSEGILTGKLVVTD